MKFTVDWLKQYIDVTVPPDELADRLTMAGLEVDNVLEIFTDLAGVKVAEIREVAPHPEADRLVLCQVAVGEETMQIVCGAPNAREGLFSAIALPGTTLPGGLTIRKSKIRGQISYGMLCSEKDLGISEDHSGIMELEGVIRSGEDLVSALGLRDTVIEVDLTPNRPDCTSVIGIGREAAVFCNSALTKPVTPDDLSPLAGEHNDFSVEVEDADCPRYAARLLRNVKVGPSPWWLRKRLLSVGQRPINNVVDITNFVMLEYGQPLHAFDFKKLGGSKIVVRKARQGEEMTTLDGMKRSLEPSMLMICDAEKPVAVAGVMGGENSEVDESTGEVLLESACFDPVSVRRTARKLNIGTDASYRFERGVDPELPPLAMERAVRLLEEIAGAEAVPGGIDARGSAMPAPAPLSLRISRTNDLLGHDFTVEEIEKMLSAIELRVERSGEDILEVTPPTFRVDLEREIDLVEEVARLKGYNRFPLTMPLVPMTPAWTDPARKLGKDMSAMMTALGFYEAINYSFVTPKHFDMLGLAEEDPLRQTVKLLNPLGEEQSIMRSLLLPGLLENVRRNVNYQVTDVRLFEIGKCFHPQPGSDLPEETPYLTAVISGARHPSAPILYFGREKGDIFDVKGVAATLLQTLRCSSVRYLIKAEAAPPYAKKNSFVEIHSRDGMIGEFGSVAGPVLKNFGIKQDVCYLRLNLDRLLAAPREKKHFSPLPKFPSVKWDIAVIVPERIRSGEIIEAIMESGVSLVEKAELFDIYRGDNVGENMKSIAVTITYRSDTQTLDDETVGREHQKILDLILTRFEGQLREV